MSYKLKSAPLQQDFTVDWAKGSSKKRVILLVEREGATLAHEELNIHSSKDRESFIESLVAEGCDPEMLKAEIMHIAKEVMAYSESPSGNSSLEQEIDVQFVERPERIIRKHLSVIAVPVMFEGKAGPIGQWRCYAKAGRGSSCDGTQISARTWG